MHIRRVLADKGLGSTPPKHAWDTCLSTNRHAALSLVSQLQAFAIAPSVKDPPLEEGCLSPRQDAFLVATWEHQEGGSVCT